VKICKLEQPASKGITGAPGKDRAIERSGECFEEMQVWGKEQPRQRGYVQKNGGGPRGFSRRSIKVFSYSREKKKGRRAISSF